MSKKIRHYFTKMHGAGNDYIYVDALGTPTSFDIDKTDLPDLARQISDRHFGVGSDGLIAILPSADADFRMRMFNADGSEAQMCGNGARCVAKYLYDKGFTQNTVISLETLAGIKILHLNIEDGEVKSVTVEMGKPMFCRKDIPVCGDALSSMIKEPLVADDKTFEVTAVGMGNPHGVIFVDELTDRLIHHYGKLLETHSVWPEKANIEFVKIIDPTHLKIRVWERGSGETLACGTGTCAAVVAAATLGLSEKAAEVELLGGTLSIRYDSESGLVFMTGPASTIAEGVFFYAKSDDMI